MTVVRAGRYKFQIDAQPSPDFLLGEGKSFAAIGDSNTNAINNVVLEDSWPAICSATLKSPMNIQAKGGSQSSDWATGGQHHALLAALDGDSTDFLLVMIGTVDAFSLFTPPAPTREEYGANVRSIVATALGNGVEAVLLIPPVRFYWTTTDGGGPIDQAVALINSRIVDYADELEEIAGENGKTFYGPENGMGYPREYYNSSAIHLNEIGHAKLAKAIEYRLRVAALGE